jgi:predicted nuclease of predicted toxin-antitoxin system
MAWKPIDITDDEIADATRRWKSRARFLVDESLGSEAAVFLRQLGWNVKAVQNVGLEGHSDEDVYAFAWREERIVLTHDTDLLDDRRFPPYCNPGVVVLPGASGETEPLVRALLNTLAIVGRYGDAYHGSKIVFNADGTLVVRSRDQSTGTMANVRYRLRKNAMPELWVDE